MAKTKFYNHFEYSVHGIGEGKYISITGFDNSISNPIVPSHIDGVPVRSIGYKAFNESSITSIELPETLRKVKPEAFALCKSLTSIAFPDSVEEIGRMVCNCCISLETVRWSKSARVIPMDAFSVCFSLKNIENIENVIFISEYAFHQTGLTSFNIPMKLEGLSSNAFSECHNLKNVRMLHLPYIQKDVFKESENVKIYCGSNAKVKEWSLKNGFPVVESKINTFLENINTDIERGE